MELNELTTRIFDAGIVGAGGAGFPSHKKLATGADILLVNGSECEPLLYTDYFLLQKELSVVLSGIRAVLEGTGIPRALLCVKQHTAQRLGVNDGDPLAEHISLKLLPDVYPVGDEVSLIYESTHRVVKPGNLPVTAGVIVYNVETVFQIGRAVLYGLPVTEKWLTIGGDIPEPIVLKVPVGIPVSEIFQNFGIIVPEDHVVLDGGPSMGKLINYEQASVTKTTKGILVLPEDIEAVRAKRMDVRMSVARAETGCCQCTRCTDMCPRALMGYPIEPHKLVRTAKQAIECSPELALSATLCCGCGLCTSLACCQGISPKAVIDYYKSVLAKNKLRYSSDGQVKVSPEREYRIIPSERWESALGVRRFDRVPVFRDTFEPSRVCIPLSQHIGAPSVPVVENGALVERGQLIAKSAAGLSANQHASISGRVTLSEGSITIEKVSSPHAC